MTIASMQKHLAFARAHKVVLLIWNVDAVTVHFVQAILIRKTVQPKNIVGVDRFDGAGMKVRIELSGLHNTAWPRSLYGCPSHNRNSRRRRKHNRLHGQGRLSDFKRRAYVGWFLRGLAHRGSGKRAIK